MIGGAGTQVEIGSATVGGVTFEGNLGAGASTMTMVDNADSRGTGAGGHATFITGNGTNIIGAAASPVTGVPVGHNTFVEGASNPSGGNNTAEIFNFSTDPNSGDIVSLANPAGGFYSTVPGAIASATQIAVNVSGTNTTLTFGDGTTWNIVGVTNLTGSNFH